MEQYVVTTPPGRGAIAVVLVTGDEARNVVASFFQSATGQSLVEALPYAVLYGMIQGEDVLVCPTEQGVEIHCHGSAAAVERLGRLLAERNIAPISTVEFLRETCSDPIRRRALELLPQAVTWKTARILLDQYHGALQQAQERGDATDRWRTLAPHLITPWRVVLAGEPNVGKSSLFNAILGFARAMVDEQAGTTRDILREQTVLDGWLVEFFDTAGLHDAENWVESEGIRRVADVLQNADLILRLHDANVEKSTDLPFGDFPPDKTLEVWNKSDLLPTVPRATTRLYVSATTGSGLPELFHQMIRRLVPEEPVPGTGIPLDFT